MTNKDHLKCKLLSIDAIGGMDAGWEWNDWHTLEAEMYIKHDISDQELIDLLVDSGDLVGMPKLNEHITIDDDGHNIVICDKNCDDMPILALCYGEFWEFNEL